MFLKGYTSTYWNEIQQGDQMMAATISHWDTSLVRLTLMLYKNLWADRNSFLHGSTRLDSKLKLREKVIADVTNINQSPPKLHSRFPKVLSIPLDVRLRRSPTSLQQWMVRVAHQIKVSKALSNTALDSQLTLHQVYSKHSNCGDEQKKFPP